MVRNKATKKEINTNTIFQKTTKEGVPIKRTEQAQKVAEFLNTHIWGLGNNRKGCTK